MTQIPGPRNFPCSSRDYEVRWSSTYRVDAPRRLVTRTMRKVSEMRIRLQRSPPRPGCPLVSSSCAASEVRSESVSGPSIGRATRRLTVLDFGLVQDMNPDDQGAANIDRIAGRAEGSLPYMSPEQVTRRPLTEASDWYALGVMLYEALVGFHPYEGDAQSLAYAKLTQTPIPPGTLNVDVPKDLEALCLSLLSIKPANRPEADEILESLGVRKSLQDFSVSRQPVEVEFMGRRDQLATLSQAYEQTRTGRQVTVYVEGRSGVGKTALVTHFLSQVGRHRVKILEGRCYEQESVPFKALDPIVDSLGVVLASMRSDEKGTGFVRHVNRLASLFPVLEPLVGERCRELGESPLASRSLAFDGLRALLGDLTQRGPLVIHIDDFQWCDWDSLAAFRVLLREPRAP